MKKKIIQVGIFLFCVISLSYPQNHPQIPERPEDWRHFLYDLGAPKQYIDRQAEAVLSAADDILLQYPPQLKELQERRLALLAIDGILYDDICSPQRPPVQSFFHKRMEYAVRELESKKVITGATIWKLYDHGFIVRTASVTIAFDLIRGYCTGAEGFPVKDELMQRLIDQCDVLFMSHPHRDHIDEWVAGKFIAEGKSVVAPPGLWKDKSIYKDLIFLDRDFNKIHNLSIKNGQHSIEIIVFPGHQNEEVLNNIYRITTPEGISVCHTGDQHNRNDFDWIDSEGKKYPVDILMVNCWARKVIQLIQGFNPQLVIPGHEHELGHGTDHRKPYWLTYHRLKECDRPYLVMTWGESFHYNPSFKRNNTGNE